MSQGCSRGVLGVFYGCFKDVLEVFLGMFQLSRNMIFLLCFLSSSILLFFSVEGRGSKSSTSRTPGNKSIGTWMPGGCLFDLRHPVCP